MTKLILFLTDIFKILVRFKFIINFVNTINHNTWMQILHTWIFMPLQQSELISQDLA